MSGEFETDVNVETTPESVDQEQSGVTETPENSAVEFDYKTSLEEEKARREHNRTNAQRRLEEKGKTESTQFDPEAIREMIREETSKTISDALNINKTRDFASSITSSPEELDSVMWHLENSIKPTGDVETDVRRAHVLANEKRYQTATSEAIRTANAYESRAHAAASGHKSMPEEWMRVELTPTEEAFAKKNGMSIEEAKKAKLGL